jgi:protein-S-isoprenylcysteine O-methyltransferase Ste14
MRERYGSGIRVPPPAIFIVVFLIGLWVEGAMYRLRFTASDDVARALVVAGAILVVAGVALAVWGVATFRHHHTAVLPFHPARTLVDSGPYRFTRNPMYVGMTAAHAGGTLVLDAAWPLVLLPAAIVFLVVTVIHKEEAHLRHAFGEEYARYQARVRRWL